MSGTLHDTTGPGGPSPESNPADAEAIVKEIERPNQYEPETFDRGDLPNAPDERDRRHLEGRTMPTYQLPGFGDELETCGDDWYVFCECCGEPTRVGQTCHRSTCPRCAQDWTRRAATRAASKLKALWAYKMAATSEHQFFHHVTISLPDDWALSGDPDTVFDRTKDVIKNMMDEFGIHGIPVYHPYRGSEEEPGDDMGEWAPRVFSDREWSDVSDELEFSPHWHIIGVAPYFDISVTEEIERRTGWVVHRIQNEQTGISIGNDWDLARVVSYCLSHCGVYQTDSGDHRAAYFPNVCDRYRPGSEAITATDEQTEEMDKIVRSVVPQTLGIDYHSVACGREVPPEMAASSVSVSKSSAIDEDGSGDGTGDGDGELDEPDGDLDPDHNQKVACEGRMLGIDKAPQYLQDEKWRKTASKARSLGETWEKFKRRRGIPG